MSQFENNGSLSSGGAAFVTTHWSVVLAAGDVASLRSNEAMEKLCSAYWYPLYAYVRRKGHSVADAEDLTQQFFAQLLENKLVGQCRREGKFRSFLLASLEHFLAKEWNYAHRQKRGGGQTFLSLDDANAEARYQREPADELTAERIYDRRWAMMILDSAMTRLREEYAAGSKTELFQQLEGILSGEKSEAPYAEIATGLGMTEGAVKVAAHRLRQHYGELVRAEVTQTVSNPAELEEEIRSLFAALHG